MNIDSLNLNILKEILELLEEVEEKCQRREATFEHPRTFLNKYL